MGEPVFQWCLSGETFEELAEERCVGEVHLVGDLRNDLVGMLQFNLDMLHECTVNPLLGGGAAGLSDNSTEIALRETHLVGIETDVVLARCMLIDKADKAVENGLFATLRPSEQIDMLAIDAIVMAHHGSNETADGLTVVVGLVDDLPDGVEDVAGGSNVTLADLDLEVAHLSVEGGGQLGHGKVSKEPQAINLNIATETDGADDGAGPQKDDGAGSDMPFHQVDVDMQFTADEDAQAIVVDDERRLALPDDEQEDAGIAIDHAQFVTEIRMVVYLRIVWPQDSLDARVVH